jgi:pyrimidine operon attenuation protein/uracil phosphoribosyltransferase
MTAPSTPPPHSSLVLDAPAIERALRRIAHEIIEANPELSTLALVGIPLRGVNLAARLAALITQFTGTPVFAGVVDVSMHRDDLHRHRIPPRVERTILPDDLTGKTIVLVDDVLYSGRTCRAAMDSLSSFGRPARIQYAALVDRGHRELPIRADYVGKNLPTHADERIHVRLEAVDGIADSVWMSRAAK